MNGRSSTSDMARTEADEQREVKPANAPTPTRYRFWKSTMQVAASKMLLTYTHFLAQDLSCLHAWGRLPLIAMFIQRRLIHTSVTIHEL
jgi:hypothetical protein